MEPKLEYTPINGFATPPTGGDKLRYTPITQPLSDSYDSRLIKVKHDSKYDAGYNPLTMGSQEDYRSYKQGSMNK
jgi:hypothetical protein